jgi:hypothetical protein
MTGLRARQDKVVLRGGQHGTWDSEGVREDNGLEPIIRNYAKSSFLCQYFIFE